MIKVLAEYPVQTFTNYSLHTSTSLMPIFNLNFWSVKRLPIDCLANLKKPLCIFFQAQPKRCLLKLQIRELLNKLHGNGGIVSWKKKHFENNLLLFQRKVKEDQ